MIMIIMIILTTSVLVVRVMFAGRHNAAALAC